MSCRTYIPLMKHIIAITALLALTAPALAETAPDKRRIDGEFWVRTMDWVNVCTTGQGWKFTEDERLRMCLKIEQEMRDVGNCMYSPGVIGIWNGTHCR